MVAHATLLEISCHGSIIDIDTYALPRVTHHVFGGCEQERHRPASASAQSDQRLCKSLI